MFVGLVVLSALAPRPADLFSATSFFVLGALTMFVQTKELQKHQRNEQRRIDICT
jgi:hypothetical protein